jgi:hypothetical protein
MYIRRFSIFFLAVLFSCTGKEVLNSQSGNWVSESQLNGPARSEAVSFVAGNLAYVGTGWDGLNNRYNDFWSYDPVSNVWSQLTTIPGPGRSSAIAFSVNGKGYVGTGFDGFNYLNDFYEYDPAVKNWSKKTDFAGGPRYEAIAFGLADFGYLGTGFDGSSALKDFYRYDPSKDKWTDIGFSGNKRYGAVTFVYNNKAYLVTGVNSGAMQTDFWVFDPASYAAKWSELRHINNYSSDAYDDGYTTIVRWNASAFVIPPYAYVSTGENGVNDPFTWLYDFSQDLWGQKTSFEGPPTTGAVGFTLDPINGGGGYIGTGRIAPGQAGSSDYLWQFYPDQTSSPNDN